MTQRLGQFKAGQEAALAPLFHRYWPYLTALARKKLGRMARGVIDEQDVAQSAWWSFYRGATQNRFPRLNNRDDLLGILNLITVRKAAAYIAREAAHKRGGRVRRQSTHFMDGAGDPHRTYESASIARDPDPAKQIEGRDLCEYFLQALPKVLRPFAQLYLAGWTHAEIAQARGCGLRTAQRRQAMIARLWRELAQSQ